MENPLKTLLNKIFNKKSNDLAFLKNREGGTQLFDSIIIQNITPDNSAIGEKDFIHVVYKGKPIWALFKCPCGCNTIISLSLQKVHNPHWRLSITKNKRPTLYPSIWQKTGCLSHFWISDGYIYWAKF